MGGCSADRGRIDSTALTPGRNPRTMASSKWHVASESLVESPYAWRRLAVSLALSTIGGVGLWSVVVVLPAVQTEFDVARGSASLPYTATMLGFALGGILMGRLADRLGIVIPLVLASIALGLGYLLAAQAPSLGQFALAQGLVIGMFGSSVTFAPLVADVSHWFTRRRGIAVAICASGNYLAGTVWPPILQHFAATRGWRPTMVGVGLFCAVTMLPLTMALRRRSPVAHGPVSTAVAAAEGTAAARVPCSPAGAADGRGPGMLRRHVDAPGAHRGVRERPWPRSGARRQDALRDAGPGRREPPRLRLDRRPGWRGPHPAPGIGAAMPDARALPAVQRPRLALRRLRPLRPVAGRHRAGLRHHRARVLRAPRSRAPGSAAW